MNIKVIAFDADDTLWVNESYFLETEKKFCSLLSKFMPEDELAQRLLQIEIGNLKLYGYGVKGYILSMIEAAIKVTGGAIGIDGIEKILDFGKSLLNEPIELLDQVEEVLLALKDKYRLVVATKGDLLDQERKLKKSGLAHYFHHIEIMSDKKEDDYLKLIKHLDIEPKQFMMIGNSVKSDILPVLGIGGHAVHIPFHTTWAHEHAEVNPKHRHFRHRRKLIDVLPFLLP